MAAVGSYIRSMQERPSVNQIDKQIAIGRVLRAVSPEAPVTFGGLISSTGMNEQTVRMAVDYLRKADLIKGTDEGLSVTDLGYRAQLIVAS
jgi:predicted transcriptional regulator